MRALLIGSMSVCVLSMLPPAARAGCTCVCMNGSLTTVCSALEEAQRNGDLCAGRGADHCPVDLRWRGGERYAPPADGALNCRAARVWNEAEGTHVSVRVCDVQPAA